MTKRAILHISWGRQAFQKVVLNPGDRLTIGASELAGLPILHDKRLAATQVEVLWDGAVAQVQAQNGSGLILLNGQPAVEGQLGHSEWFRIGDTTLMLHRERYTPAKRRIDAEKSALSARVLDVLRSAGGDLYAVLDAACDERILELLREAPDETRSLYEGVKGDAMADVAPYLVKLDPQGWLLESLVEEGWGNSWGIYLEGPCPFNEMRRHFRRLLRVKEEGADEYLYFRFYDPRVLRVFVPTCNAKQMEQFYGPVCKFWVEDSAGEIQALPHSRSKRDWEWTDTPEDMELSPV